MSRCRWLHGAVPFALAAMISMNTGAAGVRQDDAEPVREAVLRDLAPTGQIRACSNAGNSTLNRRDPATGDLRGVSADLTREVGLRLGIDTILTGYASDPERNAAVARGECDLIFTGVTTVPTRLVDLTAPFLEADLTLPLPESSPIRSMRDVDYPGIRVSTGTGPRSTPSGSSCTMPN